MPYSLVFIENGERSEIKPIACDNPLSPFGFEDRGIERKAKKLAAKLSKTFDGLDCYVENYIGQPPKS